MTVQSAQSTEATILIQKTREIEDQAAYDRAQQ